MFALKLVVGQFVTLGETILRVTRGDHGRVTLVVESPDYARRFHPDGRPVINAVPIVTVHEVQFQGTNWSGAPIYQVTATLKCGHKVTSTMAEQPRAGHALQCPSCTVAANPPDPRCVAFASKASLNSRAKPRTVGGVPAE